MKASFYMLLLAFGFSLVYTVAVPAQSEFARINIGYTVSFALYALMLLNIKDESLPFRSFLLLLVLPAVLLPFLPNLSDDFYRFIWDGYCTNEGINPYTHLPSELVSRGYFGLDEDLYGQLNSPDYYSVYPSFSQFLFAAVTRWSSDLTLQILLLKSIYLIFHILGGLALYAYFERNALNKAGLLAYYANPLVLIEGIGNLHAEINMVSLIFIAVHLFDSGKIKSSAFALACSIAVKLIPALFLVYFYLRRSHRIAKEYLLWVLVWTTVLFIPVALSFVRGGFISSIDLYFRKFEFNASIYYLLRALGYLISGYNLIAYIGPILLVVFLWFFLRYAHAKKEESGRGAAIAHVEIGLLVYVLLSTTVHPWYLIGLCAILVFKLRYYIVVWSYVATWTYINYAYPVYTENLWVVALEYFCVFGLFWFEYRKNIPLKFGF